MSTPPTCQEENSDNTLSLFHAAETWKRTEVKFGLGGVKDGEKTLMTLKSDEQAVTGAGSLLTLH